MPGVAGAAAIAGVASIAGGLLAGDSARDASNAQQAAQQKALFQQQQQFAITQQNLQPFIQAGQTGIQGLEQGATAEGLDQRLHGLLQDLVDPLVIQPPVPVGRVATHAAQIAQQVGRAGRNVVTTADRRRRSGARGAARGGGVECRSRPR